MMYPQNHGRELRAKQNRKRFAARIITPTAGPIVLPANGTIYLRSVSGCAAGTTAATYKGRTIQTPLLAAGRSMLAGFVERGATLTPVVGFDVLLDMGLGKVAKIGAGV